ncbi:MAG TPA: dihydrofolate reductase [Hyphomicrobiaceae bacterium]|nr:dihydrofolate reductase [Hyphomicrobiaceae bacterium]
MSARAKGPIVALVVAVAENGVIGTGGKLPWRMSSDLKRFRALTMGKPVIMGRRTFASLAKPLDGRENIVVTRNPAFACQGVTPVPSLSAALALARETAAASGAEEIMVIGGAQIYRDVLPFADRIYLTRVHGSPPGDTYFPEIDPTRWREVSCEQLPKGPKDDYFATLFVFDRIAGC